MRRHTLLIDADDTLWENNVFFEKLIEDFISIVEPYGIRELTFATSSMKRNARISGSTAMDAQLGVRLKKPI